MPKVGQSTQKQTNNKNVQPRICDFMEVTSIIETGKRRHLFAKGLLCIGEYRGWFAILGKLIALRSTLGYIS